jgi:RNA polymerase sigma-70 factor (ECF subfamily)
MSTQIFEHSVAQHSQVSDEQLLSRARSGDQMAFGELCLRYTGMLKQRIFRIVRNREDAEDVLQETLLSAYRHLDTFRGTCRVSTWMTTIGINTSLMILRKRRRMPEVISDRVSGEGQRFESPEFRDPGLDPEQRYIADQTVDKLRGIMRRLPAHVRTVMDLYCVQELRLKDTAANLGITEAAAKSRVLRGRKRLRRSLSTRRIADYATVERREDHPPV